MSRLQRSVLYLFMGLLSVLLFTACSGTGGKVTVDKNERLSQRLNSYIDARKHSNLGSLQQFYLKPEQARIGKIIVKECKIVAIDIKGDGLNAVTKLENKIQAMGFTFDNVPSVINWQWSKNDWYITVSVNAGNPFAGGKRDSSQRSESDTKETVQK